jgi:hypothetical protein
VIQSATRITVLLIDPALTPAPLRREHSARRGLGWGLIAHPTGRRGRNRTPDAPYLDTHSSWLKRRFDEGRGGYP